MNEYFWGTRHDSPIERLVTAAAKWIAYGQGRAKFTWSGPSIFTDEYEMTLDDFHGQLTTTINQIERHSPAEATLLDSAFEEISDGELVALRKAVALRMVSDRELDGLMHYSQNEPLKLVV